MNQHIRGLMEYNNLKTLIQEGDFGYYSLSNLSGTETYAFTGAVNGEDQKKISSAEIVDELERKLKLIGAGSYKIVLKKDPKTPSKGEVIFRFNYGDPKEEINPAYLYRNMNGMGAMPYEDVDARIQKAVTDALSQQEKLFQERQEKERLERRILELEKAAKRPRTTKKQDAVLNGIFDLAKIGGSMVAAKYFPESLPLINATIAGIAKAEEDNDEEEGETITVNRQD